MTCRNNTFSGSEAIGQHPGEHGEAPQGPGHHLAGHRDEAEVDRVAVLGLQIGQFGEPDAVLAGRGAAERQRPPDHAVVHGLGPSHFAGIVRIDDKTDVKIAIADMT